MGDEHVCHRHLNGKSEKIFLSKRPPDCCIMASIGGMTGFVIARNSNINYV